LGLSIFFALVLVYGVAQMRRLMTFFLGMVTGGVLIYAALNFHLIRAQDGLHFVRKMEPQIAATYVDIRGFTFVDWKTHTDVAAALVRAEKTELMQSAASDALNQSLDRWLGPVDP
jgi:hypothetical protein